MEIESKLETKDVLFVGQTFDAWEQFTEIFDELCTTTNTKYRMNDCKYTTTANRKAQDSSEGLYNEAHKYAYAKLTCVLCTHGKQKRTNESGEQAENGDSHVDCNAHIYLVSDRKLDKLVVKDLNIEHDHDEKSSIQRERRHKRLSYALMARPAPEIEKPKKKPKISTTFHKHKEPAKSCSIIINESNPNKKEDVIDKHKSMMNVCMQLWENSLDCSDEEFSERYLFLQTVLNWWKCGASANAQFANHGSQIKASLFVRENSAAPDEELDSTQMVVEATAEDL